MTKEKQIRIPAISMLLVIAVILIGGIFIFVPGIGGQAGLSGGSFLKIDSSVQDNNAVMTVAVNGNSQYIEGKTNISTVKEPFTLTVSNNQDCRWQLKSTNTIMKRLVCTGGNRFSMAGCGYNCAGCISSGASLVSCSYGLGNPGTATYEYPKTCSWETIGNVYELEPQTIKEVNTTFTLKIAEKTYSDIFDNNKMTGKLGGIIPIEWQYDGTGRMDCGSVPSDIVVYASGNTIKIKDRSAFISYKGKLSSIESGAISQFDNSAELNSLLDSFLASAPTSQLCPYRDLEQTQTLQTANIKCDPVVPVSIGVYKLEIPSSEITIVKPVGVPEIKSVEVGETEAGKLAEVKALVANKAVNPASFDVSLKCKNDLSPFAERFSFAPSEEKTITAVYSGAGIITSCILSVQDVNSMNVDTKNVVVSITPICSREPLSSAQIKVNTIEQGCVFVCSKQYQTDLDPQSCLELKNYDRFKDSSGNELTRPLSYSGIHCTGIGKYTDMNDYMDYVASAGNKFIPQNKAGSIFVSTIGNKPFCDYLTIFGGTEEFTFVYGNPFFEAVKSNEVSEGATSEETSNAPEVQPEKENKAPDYLIWLGIVGVLICGGLFWYFFKMRR